MNIEKLIGDNVRTCLSHLNKQCSKFFGFNQHHVIERMKKRNIDILDVTDVLCAIINDESQTIQKCFMLNGDDAPMRIEIRNNSVILMFSRLNDNWKFSTVLNPKKHSLHDDEMEQTYLKTFTVNT